MLSGYYIYSMSKAANNQSNNSKHQAGVFTQFLQCFTVLINKAQLYDFNKSFKTICQKIEIVEELLILHKYKSLIDKTEKPLTECSLNLM